MKERPCALPCITTVTLAVVGTTSAGGLTALLARKVWGRRRADLIVHPRMPPASHPHLPARTSACLMTTFVLIPGAGGVAWYWHRVLPLLERAGYEALAVDLPGDDAYAGINAYADLVIAAIGTRSDVTLVAQSMGAFTAALVCARVRNQIRRVVFVNAMIPVPGETAGEWWDHTGWLEARRVAAERGGYSVEFDVATYFLHDLPKGVATEGAAHERREAEIAFREPASFQAWPVLHVVVGKDDRFFPAEFQARLASERLGKNVEELPGGHLLALSRPRQLADLLLAHATEIDTP
jgi:pimeloyl-ACP methyl ester carboxylesterase